MRRRRSTGPPILALNPPSIRVRARWLAPIDRAAALGGGRARHPGQVRLLGARRGPGREPGRPHRRAPVLLDRAQPVPTATPQRGAPTAPVATPTVPAPNRSLNSSLASFMGLNVSGPTSCDPVHPDRSGRPADTSARAGPHGSSSSPSSMRRATTSAPSWRPRSCRPTRISVRRRPRSSSSPSTRIRPPWPSRRRRPALSETGLGALPNWHMVTGPLATLDAVWKAYGVSISVDKKTGLEAHNDVMTSSTPAETCATGRLRSPTRARPAPSAFPRRASLDGARGSRPTPSGWSTSDRLRTPAEPQGTRFGSAAVGCSSGSRSSSCCSSPC